MTATTKATYVVVFVVLLCLGGCGQGSGPNSPSARLREVEAKAARLEDDFKSAVAARDQARKKVASLEEQRAQLLIQVEQLERVAKERDELKVALSQRTSERDTFHMYLSQFSRELLTLAHKVEQAANSGSLSTPPVIVPPRITPAPSQDLGNGR